MQSAVSGIRVKCFLHPASFCCTTTSYSLSTSCLIASFTLLCYLFNHPSLPPLTSPPSPLFLPLPDSPGAARFWIWSGTGTLASEARVRRPPLLMRSHISVMCFLRRVVSRGRPSTGPPACARDVAWSLGLRERQLRKRWETAASQLSSQP